MSVVGVVDKPDSDNAMGVLVSVIPAANMVKIEVDMNRERVPLGFCVGIHEFIVRVLPFYDMADI